MLQSVTSIHKIAEEIFEAHKVMTTDDTTIKLLERKRKEALKAQNNMIKAIEQGIITEATKNRLTELESEVTQLDFEINKEKTRSYTYLTCEQIEMYLSKFVFENTDDIKVRKLIINAFIREVILYNDEIVINYNFTENPEHLKLNKDHIEEAEKQIENATPSAFSLSKGAFIFTQSPPQMKKPTFLKNKSAGFLF